MTTAVDRLNTALEGRYRGEGGTLADKLEHDRLSRRGEPMVVDFAIALAVAQAGGGRFTELRQRLGER